MKRASQILVMIGCVLFGLNVFAEHLGTSTDKNKKKKDKDPVLFTIGDEEVTKSEFIYVYEKHNAQDTNLYSKASIDEYLDLYIKFKLKVKEAEALGMDTSPAIVQQLGQYRKQLSKNYLYDKDISEQLMQEAYERMSKEVRTSHILVMVGEKAAPADTLEAYNKITSIRKQIVDEGGDFTTLAKQHSQDPSVKDNGGDLGYITAFQTVYPFESAAYNTPVDKISKPIRTKFGYHLVNVLDVREAKGTVQVAHILVKASDRDDEATTKMRREKIHNIYNIVSKDPKQFSRVAMQQSDDKTTSMKGGTLDWFGTGRMLPEFEEVAFDLEEKDQISKPFRTKLGWHIVKLLDKKSLGTYEETQSILKRKLNKDSRSRISKQLFSQRLKKDYAFTEKPDNLKDFTNQVDVSILKGKWRVKDMSTLQKTLFTVTAPGEKPSVYTQKDFAAFVQTEQAKGRSASIDATVKRLYSMFVERKLLDIEESLLEIKHPDFAKLMKEFRDGTLLFDLTEKKVWKKAVEDTTGLEAFFKENQSEYQWTPRVDATIFTCQNNEIAEQIQQALNAGKTKDEIEQSFNAPGAFKKQAIIKHGVFEEGQNKIVGQLERKVGVSEIITTNDGQYSVAKVNKLLPGAPKKLEEARGYVVADYQTKLEKEWVDTLKDKYPVQLNEKVLKSLYKEKESN